MIRLDPVGLIGVADFYTSSRASTPLERAIGNGIERHTSFLLRWFWQMWYVRALYGLVRRGSC